MKELIEKSDNFREKVERLMEKYPEHKDEIENSSSIIYTNGIANLNIDKNLVGKEIYSNIENIYNAIYKK